MAEAPLDQVKTTKRNGFSKTPNCIWEIPELTSKDIVVWCYLNSHDDSFNPSLSLIQKATKTTKPTLLKTIKRLESFNMIKIVRGDSSKTNDTNRYFVVDNSHWDFSGGKKGNLLVVKKETYSGKKGNLLVVKKETTKKNNENNNKKTNVEAPPVDNSGLPIPKPEFKDIFEFINQIHGWNDRDTTKAIAKYYTRLLKKNEVGTINLIEEYRKGVKNGAEFDKSIRLRAGYPIFDTAFKTQFEKDLENNYITK